MTNTLYVVHSDVDENNIKMEFNFKDDAINYAKGNDNGVKDETWVEAVELEFDDHGNAVKELSKETVWTYADELAKDAEYAEGDKLDTIEDQAMLEGRKAGPTELNPIVKDALGDEYFKDLAPETVNKMFIACKKDMGACKSLEEFLDWCKLSGNFGNFIFDFTDDLSVDAICDLGVHDEKFMKTINKAVEEAKVDDNPEDPMTDAEKVEWAIDGTNKTMGYLYDIYTSLKEDYSILFDPAFDTEFSEPCCDVDPYADCNAENCKDELVDNIEGVIKALGIEQEIVDDFTKCEWPDPDDYYKCGEKCCDKPAETATAIIAAEVPADLVDKIEDPEVKVEIPIEGEGAVEAPATVEEPVEPRVEVPDTVAEVNDVKPEETEISEISDADVENEVPAEEKEMMAEIEQTPADENPKDMIDGELVDAKDPTEAEVEVEDEKKDESLEEAMPDPNDPDLTKDVHAYAYYLNQKLPE